MRLSIITITYNNFEELTKTLESIPRREFIESVVINGGSCQKTRDFLNSHYGISINEADQGISDAFNKGIEHASGDALIFLNSGDLLIDETYPERALKELDQNNEYSFVFSDIIFDDQIAGKLLFKAHPNKNIGSGMPYFHQTMVIKKDVFHKTGTFSLDYKIAMDFDHVVRMKKMGMIGKYITGPVIEMDGHGISATNEILSILECKKSITQHGMMDLKNWINLYLRLLKMKLRKLVEKVFGKKLILAIKNMKYQKK